MAFQSRSPALALRFDAGNPVALIRAAKADITAGVDTGDGGERAISAASRSIAQNPLNADAFGLYGLINMANADDETVSRQVIMADRLSRRDLSTQLFLIEDSVRRNDVAEALRHYDSAMRASEGVRPTLFAILAKAMREPAIRKRFMPYMTASNPWLEAFFRYATANPSDSTAVAQLAIEADGLPDGALYDRKVSELLSLLVQQQEYDTARRLYLKAGDGDPELLTDAAFTDANTDQLLMPITWQPSVYGDIDPLFVVARDGTLEFEARIASGFTGYVLQKLFMLPPGSYTLSGSARHISAYLLESVNVL
ncbi:hypothetical protein GW813_09455 [bacterium]|nr:hypothetical protein [bacterium]